MTAALLPSVRRQSIADGFRCQSSSINIDKYGKIRADVSFLFFGTQKIVGSLRLDSISLIDRKNLARFRSPCFSLATTTRTRYRIRFGVYGETSTQNENKLVSDSSTSAISFHAKGFRSEDL